MLIRLDHLNPLDLYMIEQMSALTAFGKRVRQAGFPCKQVYRAWPPEESDIRLRGCPVEFCVYIDLQDRPHTACFSEDAVLVSEGW